MVEQPAALVSPATAGSPAPRPPAGFNQRNVQIGLQLVESTDQAASGQPSSDDGEINLSHVRCSHRS